MTDVEKIKALVEEEQEFQVFTCYTIEYDGDYYQPYSQICLQSEYIDFLDSNPVDDSLGAFVDFMFMCGKLEPVDIFPVINLKEIMEKILEARK